MKLKLCRRVDQEKQIKTEFVVTGVIFSYLYNFTHTFFDVDAFKKNKILS